MTTSVFYSWQSDLPNRTNRGLIERALEGALQDALSSSGPLHLAPTLDRDTLGLAGSPNISAGIFAKIGAASVFIADVTPVNPASADRKTPNPNVLVELGFAVSELSWNRVVLVLNTAFGRVEDLPFDLRQHRILRYESRAEDESRVAARGQLRKALGQAVERVLHADEMGAPPPKTPRGRWAGVDVAQKQPPMPEELGESLLLGVRNHRIWRNGDAAIYLPLHHRTVVGAAFLRIRLEQQGPCFTALGRTWGVDLYSEELGDSQIVHVAEHDFEGDASPELVIAVGDGVTQLRVVVFQYHPPALWKDAMRPENWSQAGDFQGQSQAWLKGNEVQLPFGSQGLFQGNRSAP